MTDKQKLAVFIKLQKARALIKQMNLKKAGRNSYSEYDYYTPEQIDALVTQANSETNLFNKFDLVRDEHGLKGVLTIIDMDTGETETFETATDAAEIKATNAAQRLGGTMTYSNRYLLMFAYDIVDNNLDPDTTNNTKRREAESKKQTSKPDGTQAKIPKNGKGTTSDVWLSDKLYNRVIEIIRSGNPPEGYNTVEEFVDHIKGTYKMKNIYKDAINDELKSDFNKALQSKENLDNEMEQAMAGDVKDEQQRK